MVSYSRMAEDSHINQNIVAINSLDAPYSDESEWVYDLHRERKRRREGGTVMENVGENSNGNLTHFLSVGPGAQAYREH